MKLLLKEPLLHFLLLGAALFFIYSLSSAEQNSAEQITISASKQAQLEFAFEKTRQRKPNKQELAALIKNYYKEQVAYQKGLEMGLLDGDSIIQKRVQQKVEFIVEDAVSAMAPTDEQLNQFLTERSDDYRTPHRFSFIQLYFDPQQHEDVQESLQVANQQLTTHLKDKASAEQLLALSDNIFLELEYVDMPYQEVARYFGSNFADALLTLPTEQWQQNIKSGYGVHIVKLMSRSGGEIQVLSQIRNQVKQDWLNQQRQLSLERFYQLLFEEYKVNVAAS